MIRKNIDENSISVIPEDSDDLLNLRRIIKTGDRLTADTIRTIKQEKDYSRPDKGKRVKIRIALCVEKISLDGVLDRLRISGTILESNNESVPHGSHHSFNIRINDGITISKKRWSKLEKRLLSSGNDKPAYILLAIDTSGCGLARLQGTHLEFFPDIYSGAGGKRYKMAFNVEKFFGHVYHAVESACRSTEEIIIFGPGQTKKKFSNFVQKESSRKIRMVEGIDSGGEDGIHIFAKSQAMREIISDSKLAKVASAVDEIMMLASKKSTKFAMGIEETEAANNLGAVRLLVFSEMSIQEYDESRVIDLLNDAEEKGVETFGVDSSTDLGLRVTGLGGIVALLRYALVSPDVDSTSQS